MAHQDRICSSIVTNSRLVRTQISFRVSALLTYQTECLLTKLSIFSSTIIAGLNPNPSLIENVGLGTVVNCFYLPGCIVGGLLMDRIGRKQTMTLGFALWVRTAPSHRLRCR